MGKIKVFLATFITIVMIATFFSGFALATRVTKANKFIGHVFIDDGKDILLPTVSAKVRHNHDEIRDYFVHFLSKKPHGRIIEQNIRIYDNIAVNSGLYTISLMEDGGHSDVAARFTFVYQKYEDGWLVIEHHSSILPA